MSIFNTAIQTLSNVAIQEAGITLPDVTNVNLVEEMKAELDGMEYLTEDEMVFTVEMVPVRENRRLGKYLIEMEDLSRFMITNRITSVSEAVGYILECNDLVGQYDNVALVIDEASILDELASLGINPNDGEYPNVQPGVGQTVFGDPRALKDIRRIANSKELLDKMFNNYGLPFVRKNYKQLGLLETVEDVKMDAKPGDKVLQEKDKKSDASTSVSEGEMLDHIRNGGKASDFAKPTGYEKFNNTKIGFNNGDMFTSTKTPSGRDAMVMTNPNPSSTNEDTELSEHEQHLQYLRDIVSGKYDER